MAYGLLKGKKGIISGALNEQSIAWKAALKAVEEGAEIVLTNAPVSLRLGTINELAEQCNAPLIPADATSVEDLEKLVDGAMEHFGGKFDFVLHSIGMSPNVRKGRPYDDINYDYLGKTLDISAISLHKMLSVLYKKDALNEWGSVVALTYIAAQRYFIVVQLGDDMATISRETGISLKKLYKYNDLSRDYAPTQGDVIYLQKKRTEASREFRKNPIHIVEPNQSLFDIAQLYGIQMKSLYKMNGLDATYSPQVGDILRIR